MSYLCYDGEMFRWIKLISMAVVVILLLVVGSQFFTRYFSHRTLSSNIISTSTPTPSTAPISCQTTTGAIAAHPFGLSLIYGYEPAVPPLLEDLGVKWVRNDFHWDLIDRYGRYNWRDYDRFVIDMQKRGIAIAGVINRVPSGIWSEGDFLKRLANFEAALVERYRPGGTLAKQQGWASYGVRYWEIFNEPNLPGYGWASKGAKPQDYLLLYAKALETSNQTIRRYDPTAVIILGGLSPRGMKPEAYLTALYERNLKDCFDVVAFHPYGYKGYFALLRSAIAKVSAVYGDAKPIWFNEFGLEAAQNRSALMTAVLKEGDTQDGFFWYTLRDGSAWDTTYGLVTSSYVKKTDYTIFRQFIAGLAQ